jgi:predicted ribosome quality control (RQC) complex YloA/Tae2 family protein
MELIFFIHGTIEMYTEILNETYFIRIGQNKEENDRLVRETVEPALWFHVAGIPSPHGILTGMNSTRRDKQAIYRTACLVKQFSKAAAEHAVRVHYIDLDCIETTDKKGFVVMTKTPKTIKI